MGGTLTLDSGPDRILHLDPDQMRSIMDKNVLVNVCESLIVRDANLGLKPGLATSWQRADDGVTWTLELRRGVTFTDGTPFDAEALQVNFERWMDPNSLNLVRTNFQDMLESLEIA